MLSGRFGARFITNIGRTYVAPEGKALGRRPNVVAPFTFSSLPRRTRLFSSAPTGHPDDWNDHLAKSPLTVFTPDEEMARDLCRQWAREELRPIVREMDEEGELRKEIIRGLFDCGLMGMVG